MPTVSETKILETFYQDFIRQGVTHSAARALARQELRLMKLEKHAEEVAKVITPYDAKRI